MLVDSYCENLLDPVRDREQLKTIDILIRELYAPVTEYTEEEFRYGYALMRLVEKYVLADRCLSGLQMGEDFKPYWETTVALLKKELAGIPQVQAAKPASKPSKTQAQTAKPDLKQPKAPVLQLENLQDQLQQSLEEGKFSSDAPCPHSISFDNALTIIGNAMQLLSSIMWSKNQAAKAPKPNVLGIPLGGKPDVAKFRRPTTELEDVVGYLDELWKFTEKYELAKKRRGQADDIIRFIEFRYLRTCLELTMARMKEWEAV